MPSGTGRGCLGSGGKPTGLLSQKEGGGIGVVDVSFGTGGDSLPLGWRGTVRCSLATETGSVEGWTRTRIAKKKKSTGEKITVVAIQGGYEQGGEDGSIDARAPVNRGWEGRPWLCRRGRLKGRWGFGSSL